MRSPFPLLLIALAGCPSDEKDPETPAEVDDTADTGDTGAGIDTGDSGDTGDDPQTLPAPEEDPDAAARLAEALRSAYGEDNLAAAVEALARAGVRTWDDAEGYLLQEPSGAASTFSMYQYWDTQVAFMARELAAGAGMSGGELNELIPAFSLDGIEGAPEGVSVPFTAILTGYVQGADTFGAQLSRALMGEYDPTAHASQVYPALVVALFLDDVGWSEAEVGGGGAPPPGSPCAQIRDFLDSVGENVTDLLSPSGSDLLSSVGQTIASAIGQTSQVVIDALTQAALHTPILEGVRQGLSVASIVTHAGSLLNPWPMTLTAPTLHYGRGTQGEEGTFTLTVSAEGATDWPQPVQDCADLLDLDLPEVSSPDGSDVEWEEGEGWGTHGLADGMDEIIDGSTATHDFVTSTETPEVHADGTADTGSLKLRAIVRRPELDELKGEVLDALGVDQVVGTVADLAEEQVRDAIDPHADGAGTVEFHEWTEASTAYAYTAGDPAVYIEAIGCQGLLGYWVGTVEVAGSFNGSTSFAFDLSEGFASFEASFTADASPLPDCEDTAEFYFNIQVGPGGTESAPLLDYLGTMNVTRYCHDKAGFGSYWITEDSPVIFHDVPECI